jgi:hypothetical protein
VALGSRRGLVPSLLEQVGEHGAGRHRVVKEPPGRLGRGCPGTLGQAAPHFLRAIFIADIVSMLGTIVAAVALTVLVY